MDRPIQYRQWSDSHKKFIYWGYGIYSDGTKRNYETDFTSPSLSNHYEDAPSEQFTGLYDKEGNKIWEGDIVKLGKWAQGLNKGDERLIVVWRDRGFWLKDPNATEKSDFTEYFGWEGETLVDWDNITVIGNIHQNPEMLNKNE